MSAPDASGTRQRKSATDAITEESKNPASLSAKSDKKVPRDKPKVTPPLSNVPMSRFLLYLVLGLTALGAFYAWRLTVWAADVGGYWNLMTGHRPPITGGMRAAEMAAHAASSAGSAIKSKGTGKAATPQGHKGAAGGVGGDIQSQIFNLAQSLGVTPAELNAAIRPLIDPTAKDAAAAAKQELEMLKREIELKSSNAEAQANENEGGGLLAAMGEAFLD